MSKSYTFDTNIVGDLHKDAYGFRPSKFFWDEWSLSSNDQRQEMWDNLITSLDAELERERKVTEQAVHNFTELIAQTIRSGAKDRSAAIRWIFEAGNFYDYDEMEFRHNLPFGYLNTLV